MYLWVVLTTFLAMIAAYFLPIRGDAQEKISMPVAQARVMQMIVKQKAGKQYMKESAYPFFSTKSERRVNYHSGQIPDATLANYLPHGFVNNPDYVTAIYCMNEGLTALNSGEDDCRRGHGFTVFRMLITYGPIPERWQRVIGEGGSLEIQPSPDLMEALRYQFGRKEMVGYVVRESGKYYVVTYENVRHEIPQPVVNNTGMGHYGIKDCLDDYTTCLAYMMWQ